jgi:hypothetical protein
VAADAILEGEMSDDLSREWQRASADSFEPAFARELALKSRGGTSGLVGAGSVSRPSAG